MIPTEFFTSVSLLLVLLNPFLLTIYLLEIIRTLEGPEFRFVLIRASMISGVVFALFAITGDTIFSRILQVRFASFEMFGGVIFLLIGVRYVMSGPSAITQLRGRPEHVAGSIAMPFMIGPGTISASMLAGARLPVPLALLSIITALALTVIGVLLLKYLHDRVRVRYAGMVERYVEVVGRASGLVIGTISIEMILQGIDLWRGH